MIISGSNQDRLDAAVQKLQQAYPTFSSQVTGAVVDLANTAELEAALRSMFEVITVSGAKPINHIAFTAGDIFALPNIKTLDVTNMHEGAAVRLDAPMVIAKVAPAYMVKDNIGDASITLTSGTNAYKPGPGWSILASRGFALEGLARGLAVDLGPQIRVNVVAPGAIQTPLLERALSRGGDAQSDSTRKKFEEGTLLKRIGRPEDVAEAYLYFMRDRYVTGQVVLSDGGRLLV